MEKRLEEKLQSHQTKLLVSANVAPIYFNEKA
jgi:hypothetical protein